MAPSRRVGAATSKTRAELLDCAERLMVHEGYAAVTYRNLASKAGVTPALVQYYFPTIDDLFTAMVKRRTQEGLERLTESLPDGQPLRALWEYASDKTGAALTAEFMALANHRKKIRAEIGEAGERIRALVLSALSDAPAEYAFAQETLSPQVLVFLLTSSPRMIAMEEAAGMSTSHAETIDFMERYLDRVEPRRADPAEMAPGGKGRAPEADGSDQGQPG